MAKITKGATFSGAVKYVIDSKKQTELLSADGLRLKDLDSVIRNFERQASLNPRVSKPVRHISLDFSAQDRSKLTNEKMTEIAHQYMERMEIKNTQYIIGRHNDKEHPHCHIIFNRINFDGHTITDQNDHIRSTKICKELTIKHGLYMAKGKENVKRDRLQGRDKTKYKIYDSLCRHVPNSKSWMELYVKLQKDGINMNFKMKGNTTQKEGIKFSADGITFNGSKIDRQFSYSKIDYALRQNAREEEFSNRPRLEQEPQSIAQHHNQIEEIIGVGLGLFDLSQGLADAPEEEQFRKRMQKKKKLRFKI